MIINKGQKPKISVSKTARLAVKPISRIVSILTFFIKKITSLFLKLKGILTSFFGGVQ